jgi:Tol biopolymer transport system component
LIAFDRAVEGGPHDVFVVHADGSGMTDITPGDDDGGCCAEWSPDSRSLIFQGGGSDEQHSFLWMVPVTGGDVTQVSAVPGEYAAYRWTPTPP